MIGGGGPGQGAGGETKAIAASAQADLDKAMPALDAAVKSLNALNKNDIVEMKGSPSRRRWWASPWRLCSLSARRRTGRAQGRFCPHRFHEAPVRVRQGQHLAQDVKRLEKFVNKRGFHSGERPIPVQAAMSLCMWPRHARLRGGGEVVRPKRKALAEAAEDALAATLAAAQGGAAVSAGRPGQGCATGGDLSQGRGRPQSLKDQAQLTEDRLVRAEKLTSGLADEQVRWKSPPNPSATSALTGWRRLRLRRLHVLLWRVQRRLPRGARGPVDEPVPRAHPVSATTARSRTRWRPRWRCATGTSGACPRLGVRR